MNEAWTALHQLKDNKEERDKFYGRTNKGIIIQLMERLRTQTDKNEVTLTDRINTLVQEKDKLSKRLVDEEKEKNDVLTRLDSTQTLLTQKEALVTDMLQRLDNKAEGDDSIDMSIEDEDIPSVLLIYDKQRASIIPKIGITSGQKHKCDKIEVESLTDLHEILNDETHKKKFFAYDMVIISCGLGDIMSTDDGFKTHSKLLKIVKQLVALEVDIAVVQLPPVQGSKMTDIRIFNMKLDQLPNKHKEVQIVTIPEVFSMNIDEVFDDGNVVVTETVCDLIARAINAKTTVPDKKDKKTPTPSAPDSGKENVPPNLGAQSLQQLQIDTYEIDSDICGLVIGSKGSNIKKLEAQTDTRMKVVDGPHVIIIGQHRNVVNAKDKVASYIKSRTGKRDPDQGQGVSPAPKKPK